MKDFEEVLKIIAYAVFIALSFWLTVITGVISDNVEAIKEDGETHAAPAVETVIEYVKVPEIVYVERQPIIVITSAERELLARLVYREARGESAECQRAVVSVVINRMAKNGETVKETIYAKGQFSTAGSLERTTPLEANYEAVDYVLANGSTLPEYVLYFSGGHPHGWAGYQVYQQIDNTYFGFMGVKK